MPVGDKRLKIKPLSNLAMSPVDLDYNTGFVMFKDMCLVLDQIESTTKRLAIIDSLTGLFMRIMKEPEVDLERRAADLVRIIYLCSGRLGPDYEGVELGLGEQLLLRAISESTGRTISKIKADLHDLGDIGLVAQNSKSTQTTMFKPIPLTIDALFRSLRSIAVASGASAVNKKVSSVKGLMAACQEGTGEAKYLFRLLEGKLRIGLAEQSILIALAQADQQIRKGIQKKGEGEDVDNDQSDPSSILKAVYNSLPNYQIIVPQLLEHGIEQLPNHCHMIPGIPVKPMLAHPTKSISEVLDRFDKLSFTCEFKYDGERAQIHVDDAGMVSLYSRNSENMSSKYPDIIDLFAKGTCTLPTTSSFVLDCEIVAWDREQHRLLPFQVLSTRKRKDVQKDQVEIQVVIFAFDLLFLNGKVLLEESLRIRRNLLHQQFRSVSDRFYFASYKNGGEDQQQNDHGTISSLEESIQGFLEEAIAGGCEGLMIKTLDTEASYEPSKRSRHWLKVKKDYLGTDGSSFSGLPDSLDLVPIGGFLGKGKRTGVYGGYLLACFDKQSEEFQAICKIGTGFTEADLERHSVYYAQGGEHVLGESKPYYKIGSGTPIPDIWFDASQVWEVKAADLSMSPVYPAAIGEIEEEKGISLRFPRFIRERGDKRPEDATDSTQIVDLYRFQQQQQNVRSEQSEKQVNEADESS